MVKKIKLFGMKKDVGRAEVTVEKAQKFVPVIRDIIKDLTGKTNRHLFTNEDKQGRITAGKIKLWTDCCVHLNYEDYEFDIFVGKARVIIALRSSLKNQKKFIAKLLKSCKWNK